MTKNGTGLDGVTFLDATYKFNENLRLRWEKLWMKVRMVRLQTHTL